MAEEDRDGPRAPVTRVAGIDLGARAVFVAVLDRLGPTLGVSRTVVLEPEDHRGLASVLAGAAAVAIDAPASRSALPHEADDRLAPKFRRARCGEVALRRAGIAVPFVSPSAGDALPAWMKVGFDTWKVASSCAPTVVETYPHGVFWRLAGTPVVHKQRPEGRARRLAILEEPVRLPADATSWRHDLLDAVACGLVAELADRGVAERLDCRADAGWPTHDGSAILLPAARAGRE